MTSLAAVQRAFKAYIFGQAPDIQRYVASTPELDTGARLEIYMNAYRARLVAVLENDFESVRVSMGDDEFRALALRYVLDHPSTYFTLRDFGRAFPGYVKDVSPAENVDLLYDLALLERAFVEAFDGGADQAASVEEATKIPTEAWTGMRIRIHPSLQYFRLHHDAVSIWRRCKQREQPGEYEKWSTPVPHIVWRKSLDVKVRRLSDLEDAILALAGRGESFVDFCACVAESVPEAEAPMRAATILRTWLREGIVSRLEWAPPGR